MSNSWKWFHSWNSSARQKTSGPSCKKSSNWVRWTSWTRNQWETISQKNDNPFRLLSLNKSVNFSRRTVVGSRLWAVVSEIAALPTPCLLVSSFYVLFLPSYSPPGFFLLIMHLGHHRLKICHIVSLAIINRLNYFFSSQVFFLLRVVLIGNHSLFDFLILKGHFLDEFSYLKDPSSQSFIHLTIAWILDDFCLYNLGAFDFWFDMFSLLPEHVQFLIKTISRLQQVLNLQNLRPNIANLGLQPPNIVINLHLHLLTMLYILPASAGCTQRSE